MKISKQQWKELCEKVYDEYCNGMQGDEFVGLILRELKIEVEK